MEEKFSKARPPEKSQNEVAIRRTYLEHAKSPRKERNYELVSDLVVVNLHKL